MRPILMAVPILDSAGALVARVIDTGSGKWWGRGGWDATTSPYGW